VSVHFVYYSLGAPLGHWHLICGYCSSKTTNSTSFHYFGCDTCGIQFQWRTPELSKVFRFLYESDYSKGGSNLTYPMPNATEMLQAHFPVELPKPKRFDTVHSVTNGTPT